MLLKPMQEDMITKLLKKNMITGDKLEELRGARRTYFAECAVEVLKRSIRVLTRKHADWAKNNTLCLKIGQADLACESVSTSYAMG